MFLPCSLSIFPSGRFLFGVCTAASHRRFNAAAIGGRRGASAGAFNFRRHTVDIGRVAFRFVSFRLPLSGESVGLRGGYACSSFRRDIAEIMAILIFRGAAFSPLQKRPRFLQIFFEDNASYAAESPLLLLLPTFFFFHFLFHLLSCYSSAV